MNNTEENELVPVEIDLGLVRRGELEEGPLRIFGSAIKWVLNRMFGLESVALSAKSILLLMPSVAKKDIWIHISKTD